MLKKEFNQIEVYSILLLSLLIIGCCVWFKVSLVYGFAISIILCCIIFIRKGFSLKELSSMMMKGLSECKILYVLIMLIGATVSIWLSSGVVPSMIYYGFEYMEGINFLFAAFLIMSLSAIFMGTAIGTISTIGVAILGIGTGFGIPSNILLGVVVSGAFIADKISPVSGLLNLTLSITNTRYSKALKSMLVTLIPALILTSVIYYILGLKYNGTVETLSIKEFQRSITDAFFISPYLLLIPILIVVMSLLGIKTIYSIFSGLIFGIVISITKQNLSFINVIEFIIFGYRGNTSSSKLNQILVSGGVVSMVEVLLIVMGAISLSSILEGTGIIYFIMNKVISKINTKRELVFKTGFISSILTVVTCDQTMGIVLPGRLLSKKYDELSVNRELLARTISDTGTIIAPLMPWNVNALLISIVSGSLTSYAPFAVLCYIAPIVTFVAASFKSRDLNYLNLHSQKYLKR